MESLKSLLARFPDMDSKWRSDDLAWTESEIRSALRDVNDEPKRLDLCVRLARVRSLRGDADEARVLLEQVREGLTANPLYPMEMELRYWIEHGRLLAFAMSHQKAAQVFLRAWEEATKIDNEIYALEAAVMLATVLPPKSRSSWLDRALEIAKKTQKPEVKDWLWQLQTMAAWRSFDLRQYEESLGHFEDSVVNLSTQEAASDRLPSFWGKARVLRAMGQVEGALALQMSLLARMQADGLVNGHVFLEIAECMQLLKDYTQSRRYFELAHLALSEDAWYSDNKSDELERMKYIFKKRN